MRLLHIQLNTVAETLSFNYSSELCPLLGEVIKKKPNNATGDSLQIENETKRK